MSSITYLDARNRQDNLPYAVFTVMPSGPSPVKKTYKNIVQQSQKQYPVPASIMYGMLVHFTMSS